MTNIDLLKQKLSLLASSGVLSASAVSTIDEAVKALDEAEHVVHCRECKYSGMNTFELSQLFCIAHAEYYDPQWFCADGRRKAEE